MKRETIYGALVVLAIFALFFFASSRQTRDSIFSGEYYLVFVNAPGVDEKTPVKMAGVNIGDIKSIDFCTDEDREKFGKDAHLIINITTDHNVSIPEDSSATIVEESNSVRWLEITPGVSKRSLRNGEKIRLHGVGGDSLGLSSFSKDGLESIRSMSSNLRDLSQIISNDSFKRSLIDTVANARFYSNELRILSQDSQDYVHDIGQKVMSKADLLEEQLARTNIQLSQTQEKLQNLSRSFKDKAVDFDNKVDSYGDTINKLASLAVAETDRFKNLAAMVEKKTIEGTPQQLQKLHKAAHKLDEYAQIAEDLHCITSNEDTQEALKGMVHKYREQSQSIAELLKRLEGKDKNEDGDKNNKEN
ncbi:MCE family protein [bacterium]|nr:MCE family protein [bacterium]